MDLPLVTLEMERREEAGDGNPQAADQLHRLLDDIRHPRHAFQLKDNFDMGIGYCKRKKLLGCLYGVRLFHVQQDILYRNLKYLYIVQSSGLKKLEVDAGVLTDFVHGPLKVLKMQRIHVKGSSDAISRLANSLRSLYLDHICLVETQLEHVGVFVDQGLRYVSTVEVYRPPRAVTHSGQECNFEGQHYRQIISNGSTVRSFTMNGAMAKEAFRIGGLGFPQDWAPNNTLEELYITDAPLFVGVMESICPLIRRFTALTSLMIEVRGNKDAVRILQEATAHPTLEALSMFLLPHNRCLHSREVVVAGLDMLRKNRRMKTLLLQRGLPNEGAYRNLVSGELAKELKVNQSGLHPPGRGRSPVDWIGAIIHCVGDLDATYHFIRKDPTVFNGVTFVGQNMHLQRKKHFGGKGPRKRYHDEQE